MNEIQTILSELSEKVKNNHPISVSQWLNYASHLNVLMLDVEDELIKAEMEVNTIIKNLMFPEPAITKISAMTASAAKIYAKGTDAYKKYLSLKALKENVTEMIRLSKKRVEMETWDQ